MSTMANNWLDLMDNDSNLSMSEDENTKPATVSASRASFDSELDSSRGGVNLLIKKKMNILSEDSLSRKRSLNEMKSTDIDRFIASMSRSPPKAKQKVNAQGRWTKTKTSNKGAVRIGFERFLNWADRDQSASKNRCVLGSSSIDNKRNILRNPAPSKLVLCAPNATNRRAQYRGRRSRKRAEHSTNQSPTASALPLEQENAENGRNEAGGTRKGGEEEEEDEDEDHDMERPAGKRKGNEVTASTLNTLDTTLAMKESEGARTAEPTLRLKQSNKENTAQRLHSDCNLTAKSVTVLSASTNDNNPDLGAPGHSQGMVDAVKVTENVISAKETLGDGEAKEDSPRTEADDDEDEDEDDDLKQHSGTESVGRRSRRSSLRVTPKLERVVFSEDLLFSKVPILEKRKSEATSPPLVSGPVFLNADEFAERYGDGDGDGDGDGAEKALEEKEAAGEDTDETTDGTKSDTTKSDSSSAVPAAATDCVGPTKGVCRRLCPDSAASVRLLTPKTRDRSWASRLFGAGSRSADCAQQRAVGKVKWKRKEMALAAGRSPRESQGEERLPETKVSPLVAMEADARRTVLSDSSSTSTSDGKALHCGESAESEHSKGSMRAETESVSTMMASPKSSKSSTSSLQIVVPSQGATDWRQKQISYGKNTVGYRNFVRKYPNKDLRFRHLHSLVSTPDPKEKIGKKRWVGKYQKWRKFLHQFDSADSGQEPVC